MHGLADPFVNPQPQLQLAIRGVNRQQGPSKQRRLPVTPHILRALRAYWNPTAGEFNVVMLWAACCLGFFRFLRAGEFTVPSLGLFDCSTHLAVGDVSVDSHSAPSFLRLRLKQLKTNPFRQGVYGYYHWQDLHRFVSSSRCPNLFGSSGLRPRSVVRLQGGPAA